MEIDPIKRSLDEIEQELEAALANLNASNQRVDDLLNEYGSGDTPARPIQPVTAQELPIERSDDADEQPPEY